MKNTTKLILGSLLLSGIGVASFLGSTTKSESIETYTPRENSNVFGKTASMEAIELYAELRRNVNTGKIEGSDFSNAWNSVKNMPSNRSSVLTLKDEGPDNVGGRTRAILVDNRGKDTVYAGSVSGGLFKSVNRGNTWSRVNAFSATLSVSTMAQTNDGTIYVGTGHWAESSTALGASGGHRSDGIYYTTDGGATFSKLNPPASWGTYAINDIVADPNSNDAIYVGGFGTVRLTKVENKTTFNVEAAITGAVHCLKISADGNVILAGSGIRTYVKEGTGNFVKVSGSAAGQIKETVVGASIRRIEYAMSHEKNSAGKYSIYASMVKTGGMLGGISASHDNGQTWQEVVPETPSSVTDASTVLTTDPFANSAQWQGEYDNIITVIPGLPKQFIVGGINLHRWIESSTAAPFGQMAQVSSSQANATSSFYAHADQHEMVWDNTNRLYIGNDGGVGISDNATTTNIRYYPANRGYNVTQYYGIAYSKYGDLAGGAQDNGTTYKELSSPGTSPLEFKDANHSDGFDCEISHLNNNVIISSRQYMEVDRSTSKASTQFHPSILSPEMAALAQSSERPFYTVLRLFENGNDLNSTDSINYYATENKAAGETITVTSKNLDVQFDHVLTAPLTVIIDTAVDALGDTTYSYTYRDTIRVQDKAQTLLAVGGNGNGGLWVTRGALRTGASPVWWKVMNSVAGRVTELEFSKDGDILYVAQSGGRVSRISGFNGLYFKNERTDTINGINNHDRAAYNYADIRSGVSQLQIQTIYTGGWVTGMGVDPNNKEHVVITLGGYGASTNILKSTTAASTTGTSSFSSIKGNMPTMPVFDAVIDMSDPNRIIAGTEFGVFVSVNSGGSWSAQNDEMGAVPVYDVRQQYRPWTECFNSGMLYFGTHGRGIWSSANFLDTDELEKEEAAKISTINLYPNPVINFTNVKFDLTNSADVTISVFSLTGQLVANETLSNKQSGEITHRINTSDLPKGVYFVNIQAEGNKFKAAKFIKQ